MLSYDNDSTWYVVEWIVSQDDCDRATAFAALAMTHGYEYIYREPTDDRTLNIAKIICERGAANLYVNNDLMVAPVELVGEEYQPDTIRKTVTEGVRERMQTHGSLLLPVPDSLLNADYSSGREPDSGYVVDEGAIYPKAMLEG